MVLDNIIILKDGTFITDVPSLIDYFTGLGFNIEELSNFFCQDIIEEYNHLQESRNEEERAADHYYCALNNLSTAIDELADKLATGKGGTKVQYAERFKKLTNYYNQ